MPLINKAQRSAAMISKKTGRDWFTHLISFEALHQLETSHSIARKYSILDAIPASLLRDSFFCSNPYYRVLLVGFVRSIHNIPQRNAGFSFWKLFPGNAWNILRTFITGRVFPCESSARWAGSPLSDCYRINQRKLMFNLPHTGYALYKKTSCFNRNVFLFKQRFF